MTKPIPDPKTLPGLVSWPSLAPPWATFFGEDDYGIFARFDLEAVPFMWRWIPPGSFHMGSPQEEPGRREDEGPQHRVNINPGFWLGETPVAQAQWEVVMGDNPSYFRGRWHPVEQVDWDQAMAMARKLSDLVPGLAATLPAEAQWEYACRAGTSTALYTGGITLRGANHAPELDAIAWYGGNSGQDLEVPNGIDSSSWPQKQYPHRVAGSHRVGLKQPNGWGLRDMLGNILEWCRDGKRPYRNGLEHNPLGPIGPALRVVRGGSWFPVARGCRSAYRDGMHRDFRGSFLGFRLLAGQEPGAAEPPVAERPGAPEARSRARSFD